MKICSICDAPKSTKFFYKNSMAPDKLRKECIPCYKFLRDSPERKEYEKNRSKDLVRINYQKEYMKEYHKRHANAEKSWATNIKNKFGITSDKYYEMFHDQNGCCFICNRHQSEFNKRLAIDHCHKTGRIRKLLCQNCNVAIGAIFEDIKITKNILNYLETICL